MKRVLLGVLALGMSSLAGVANLQSQSARFGVGGGATVPIGDYKNLDKAGWHALGMVLVELPLSPVAIRVDGMYGQTTHKRPLLGKTKLGGGTANAVLRLGPPAPLVKPYLVAGVGFYNVKIEFTGAGPSSSSESKFAFGGGVGISFGLAAAHGFVEARFLSVQTSGSATNFIPITAGVTFGAK